MDGRQNLGVGGLKSSMVLFLWESRVVGDCHNLKKG